MRLRPFGLLTLGAGVIGVSCLPGGHLPLVAPSRGASALRPQEAALPPDEGPLKLAFASPEGDEVEAPLPTFVFTRPMHRLGAAPDDPPVAATIDPPIEGSWRWIGARALQFSPRKGFPRATRFHLRVAPGLRSLDGQTLDQPLVLDFATPRLKVASMSVDDEPTDKLWLTFNQEVDPSVVEPALTLVDEDQRRLSFRVVTKENSRVIEIAPRRAWPRGVSLRATVHPPLKGTSGPLGLDTPTEQVFRERNPVRVDTLECTSPREGTLCEESSTVRLSLSDDLTVARLRPLIRIVPHVPITLKPAYEEDPKLPHSSFEIAGPFRTGVPYKITIRSSTGRRRGEPGLDQGAELGFQLVPPLPWASHNIEGTFLLPSWTSSARATASNASEASFSVTPLALEDILEAKRAGRELRPQTLASEKKGKTFPTPAKERSDPLPLGELFPENPGPVYLESHVKGPTGDQTRSQILQRTELAVSSRISPERSLFWVTNLSSTEPVQDAEIEVYDFFQRKVSGKTDAQGLVYLDTQPLGVAPPKGPRNKENMLLVVARSGNDWLYTDARKDRAPRLEVVIFPDRNFYRPGETVHLKGVARQPSSKGFLLPNEGEEIQITYRFPGGNQVSIPKKFSSWGTFSHDIEIPAEAHPDRIRILAEDSRGSLAGTSIQVHHFRPITFRVTTLLDHTSYTQGDPFLCVTQAVYLNGGSMRGMRNKTSATLSPSGISLPGLENFIVGDHSGAGRLPGASLGGSTERLGADGSIRISGRINGQEFTGPMSLSCDAEVTDPGEQVIFADSSAAVHPADFYVALPQRSWYVEPSEDLQVQVFAAAPDGTRRAEKVHVELRELLTDPPRKRASCDVTTGTSPTICSLKSPSGYGQAFEIEATATDTKGRRTVTRVRGSTHPPPAKSSPPPPRPTPPRPLPPLPPPQPPFLDLESNRVRAGEPVTLSLNPQTKPSRGLLTVEREGILKHAVLGSSTRNFTFPTTSNMSPVVQISAEVIQPIPREVPYKKPADPPEKGYQRLTVEGTERKLNVLLRPSKEEATPGETIEVDVQVNKSDGQGLPAEVTLYAVDDGVLRLSGYTTPDLLSRLTPPTEHLVNSYNTRSGIGWLLHPNRGRLAGFHRAHPPSVRMGATMVSDRDMPRSDFRPTPLFLPTLETDEQGHAHASFKLPDSLTAYRIMAVAVSKGDQFGSTEATVTARLNAQIRPVIPQSIRAGDRFEVAAVAANNTTGSMTAKVSLEATGFHLASAEPKTVHLAPGASERVTFPVEARQVGQGKLTFHLDAGDGGKDAAEVPLQAQSPVSMEASALYGKTEQAVLESVADLSTIRGDVGGLELTVSSSPVSGLAPGLEQLVEYPYGCTEQLTSRLVPLVALRTLAQGLGIALPEDTESASKKAVEKILFNRHSDGSFGLWRDSRSSPWITAYAYWGLREAKRHGIPVDAKAFEQGATLLLINAARWIEGKKAAAEASFALDVLVDLPGVDDTARLHALILLRQMLDHRADLPVFARFQLLHALARLATPADELAPLVKEVEASLHLGGAVARVIEPSEWYPELLDSRVRSSAMALRALLAASPGHPMLEPLARGLIADRGPKGWRTTQETAWALLALDAYRSTLPEGGGGFRVAMGNETLLEGLLQGAAAEKVARVGIERIAASGGAPLLFEAQKGGTVYYQARLRYAPSALPTTPVQAGFEVAKQCRPIAEEAGKEDGAATTSVPVGSWVRCEVEVISPTARSYVVLDDPVPGGFELVHPDVQGTPNRIRAVLGGPQNHREFWPDRVVFFVDHLNPGVHRWTYAARAMTGGTFVVPPTRIEEMYAPEVYGRTASTSFTITP